MTNQNFTVTKEDMRRALDSFGIEKDAILLTHSSLKACGVIEGGPFGVIEALEATVPDGTLVFPTLSQKNWRTVFEDWHMDRPSDVGLISETFRTQPGSLRSDNPTHSVSARGRDAKDIVGGPHYENGRYGIYGDYPFGYNSPWQRMYDSRERYGVRAYVLFWGVHMTYNTYKHFAEYKFVEDMLARVKSDELRAKLKSEIAYPPLPPGTLNKSYFWPFMNSTAFEDVLLAEGIAKKVKLGEGELILCDIYEMQKRTELEQKSNPIGIIAEEHQAAIPFVERLIEASK